MAIKTFREDRAEKLLKDFGNRVVKMARKNLTSRGKKASGALYKSIGYELKFKKGNPHFTFISKPYGKFIDKGVSGTLRKYKTPFKYTTKQPPSRVFNTWVVRKGLEGVRDKKGRFIPRKSLMFLIARSIKKYGIKPSNFFTDAFRSVYKNMKRPFLKAYGEDMLNLLKKTMEIT